MRSRDRETEGETAQESQSELFQCSTCDVVYIDTDKSTCPNCGDPVTCVPSTLSDQER